MAEGEKEETPNYQFMSLVYSISQAVMAQLGKMPNPATGKTERNVAQAKTNIDMLEMLKEKTKGNLSKTEEKMLLTTLSNLYLNYSDEASKEPPAETQKQKEESRKEEKDEEKKK